MADDQDPINEQAPKPPVPKTGLALSDQLMPPNLFVLPVNGPIVFPTLMAPIAVHIPKYIATVEEAISRQRILGLLMVKEKEVTPESRFENLYETGVAVKILKRLKMPDGSVNLLVHSMRRFKATKVLSENPHLVVEAKYLADQLEKSLEMDALTRAVISHVRQLSEINPFFSEEMKLAMLNAPGPGTVADLVVFALSLSRKEAQEFLETLPVKERFEKLLVHLKREQNVADLQKKIQEDVNTKINTMQREFFLKEQMKVIRKELGVEEDGKTKTARTFKERIEDCGMPEEVKKIALEELEKLETISEQSPEYNVSRNYLENLVSLPWSKETVDELDLDRARGILDADHYGLKKVKERILEFLAVRTLKEREQKAESQRKGSIICLVGPPGVGKTSVGKSIARTLGRNFYRFSLGGMRDEAEIKGHRRTYIGAMPGKIMTAMKRAGSRNAVIMLDEIDKLGTSFQGDPASALLEVLDPEQNHAFLDHYLDVPFDLSNVIFIATANTTGTIPAPLLDRMEVIELHGYTLEEKEMIAQKFVMPKVYESHGIKPEALKIEKPALKQMLMDYAREPGLRTLQQLVEKISRKAAVQLIQTSKPIVTGNRSRIKKVKLPITVTSQNLREWLGPKRFFNEIAERITTPGVVVGLAWTPTGGDILFIEATLMPGTGNLKLTGMMGEVMSESANIAWSYVKKKLAKEAGLSKEFLSNNDIHLHIPAGAIPKDGPSAGITMATALVSLLTGKLFRSRLAMTGELSLTGKVLPVGGVQEKLLAARRSGIHTVILPKHNHKDLFDMPEYVKKGLNLHYVSNAEEVFDLALSGIGKTPIKLAQGLVKAARKSVGKKKKAEKTIKTRKSTRHIKRSDSKRLGRNPI